MLRKTNALALLFALLIQGCAGLDPKENAIFVTKTSLGIDFDSVPSEASFAYSRVEGYLGPRYDNGAIPPVAGYVRTDGGVLDRNLKQFYATGRAAELVSGGSGSPATKPLAGGKKAMFFGTSTTLGVRIAFGDAGPANFVLGYRRKELSYIPVGTVAHVDYYGSVIGMFRSDVEAANLDGSKFGVAQYFGTGAAAENIASWAETKASFRDVGEDAFGEYRKSVSAQNSETVRIYRCFSNVDDTKFQDILTNANQLKLFQSDKAFDRIREEKDLKKAKSAYVDEIGITIGSSADRGTRLLGHRTYVCSLAKSG